jgi:glutamate synthase (NADPH/NADH) small chain
MAKSTGFLEYARALPKDRAPRSRIEDWREFHGRFQDEEQKKAQAARCMDCGTPFCHSGILYDGAVSGCPLGNLIPEWNDLAYRGIWKEAAMRLLMTDSFAEFTGRVCPAPCEGACTMGINDPPVTIKQNELEIIERAWEEGWITPEPPARRTGKKVAVVGSGPSGLACADLLNKAGHEVIVFEKADRAGGLLMYGIPAMKLDKKIVARRVDLMQKEGIEFRLGIEAGKDIPADRMGSEYDAIVMACGAGTPRDLKVPGRELGGVHFAIEYLSKSTKSLLDSGQRDGNFIQAWGKDVIVVGGGDTGTDCVGTALRQACKSVIQLEILPKPPELRAPDNPWPRWPKVLKTDYGQEEAAAFAGSDPRHYCVTVKEILGDNGAVKGVLAVDVEWKKDKSGRFGPVEKKGTERVIPSNLVLLAMGFLGPDERSLSAFGIEKDQRGNAAAEFGHFATNIPKVFATGDMRRGQSLVVWAIREGRAAARAVDMFLMGESLIR